MSAIWETEELNQPFNLYCSPLDILLGHCKKQTLGLQRVGRPLTSLQRYVGHMLLYVNAGGDMFRKDQVLYLT